MRMLRTAALLALLPAAMLAQAPATESVDLPTIDRIKSEALDRSQVMETMSWLTDVYGPRLANSPNYRKAAEWAAEKLRAYGLKNVRLEPVPGFGRGWENTSFMMRAVSPVPFPIIAYPRAWSPGTNGVARGEAVQVQIDSAPDFERYRGKLAGKFVLLGPARPSPVADIDVKPRLSDSALAAMAQPPAETPRPGAGGPRPGFGPGAAQFGAQRYAFLAGEQVAGVLLPARGQEGTVFTDNGFPRGENPAPVPPTVHVSIEHYGRMSRMLAKGLPVTLELEMTNRFTPVDADNVNVFGEIPGTDRSLKDEVVMLGGHFDSWHAGTGATDNAAGSATMMEAVRVIMSLGLKPKRTIRIALWASEEQGLIGSRTYARQNFRDSATAPNKPMQEKVSAYYNVDNGSGKIRGVYMQGNDAVRPIFDAWMAPFRSMGMTTLTIRNTGGTDHLAFDGAGVPGFQFIQDPLQYDTRTHHSNQDVYEQVQPDDMKFNSAVVASFTWQTAQRSEKLPRKPVPVRTAQ
jgi:carboxypeptidase Q